ncbi:MAG TPA: M1 family metallopeptidase [Solirubrobacterales bacterium]|nr:M1 family metallopeptidase [Solirubrobacterales bacterium]
MQRSRYFAALLLTALASLTIAALADAASAEEPFFPRAGNKGYNALDYDVHLTYRPSRRWLRASTTIEARATEQLWKLSFDLRGLSVTSVTVDGEPVVRFSRGRDKLRIVPRWTIQRGERFTVVVRYHGRPRRVVDPDGSSEGWIPTGDGALAVGEPQGTMAWIPCDNVPADKASFTLRINVPKRLAAISNGTLVGRHSSRDRHSYVWREDDPMSTYLAVVDIGRGQLVEDEEDGIPSWTLVDPHQAGPSIPTLARLPEVIEFESHVFGPYPFGSAGSIVDVEPNLGYALETQTRPIYAFVPDISTLVHETAHQWFGDSVGLKRWPNIWLNEGFATWTQWYYAERHSGRSARQIFRKLYRVPASDSAFWEPPSGHPGLAKNLFGTSTYVRGAMALEALRVQIGTKPFLHLLRRWATIHRHASADIEDFISLAEEVSGQKLGGFFQRWLFARGKPRGYGSI